MNDLSRSNLSDQNGLHKIPGTQREQRLCEGHDADHIDVERAKDLQLFLGGRQQKGIPSGINEALRMRFEGDQQAGPVERPGAAYHLGHNGPMAQVQAVKAAHCDHR